MKRRVKSPGMLFIVLAACFIAFVGCSKDAERGRLYDHVAYLASEGVQSKPVLEGDSLARTYIAGQFEAYGLEPAYEGEFFQEFPVLWAMDASEDNSVAVVIDKRPRMLEHGEEFVLERHSGSGHSSGKAVFVGYGIHSPETGYDDFARVDVRGKVVICFSMVPRHVKGTIRKMANRYHYFKKAQLVDSLGGLAVIYAFPSSVERRNKLQALNEKYKDRHPVQSVVRQKIPMIRMSHSALVSIMKDAGRDLDAIEKRLENATSSIAFDMPDMEISVDVVMNHHFCSGYNILGSLPGSDPAKTIIIGADYDNLGFAAQIPAEDAGAASGISLLMELARLCSERGGFGCNLLFVAYGADSDYSDGYSFFNKNIDKVAPGITAKISFERVGEYSRSPLYIHRTEAALKLMEHAEDDVNLMFSNIGSSDPERFFKTKWPSLSLYTGEIVIGDTARVCLRRQPVPIDEIDFKGMAEILRFGMTVIDDIDSGRLVLTGE